MANYMVHTTIWTDIQPQQDGVIFLTRLLSACEAASFPPPRYEGRSLVQEAAQDTDLTQVKIYQAVLATCVPKGSLFMRENVTVL